MNESDDQACDAGPEDQSTPQEKARRPIRSYVVRGGRLTPAQQDALDNWWPLYGIDDCRQRLDPRTLFGRQAPLVLEIGFGMGDSLAEQAEATPDRDFIGIEVHPPGVGKLLREINRRQLTNLRLYCHDAREVLSHCIADESLDTIQIFFPDPWHKKRHHKRRLIQPDFVAGLQRKLRAGGRIHLATDWQNYAEHMMAVMGAAGGLRNVAGEGAYASDTGRPMTKFEKRGQRLGHGVYDLVFEKPL